MLCPHCGIGVRPDFEVAATVSSQPDAGVADGYVLVHGCCPECEGLIVQLRRGPVRRYGDDQYETPQYHLEDVCETALLYPSDPGRRAAPEVPEPFRSDFAEATAILPVSPKASAALCRRVLQGVLRQTFSISKGSLAKELTAFFETPGLPSYLRSALDPVRSIGNLAAHPEVDPAGVIVEVEPGESEWLAETIEALFDFAYVQPARLAARRSQLNEKLRAMGKPELQG